VDVDAAPRARIADALDAARDAYDGLVECAEDLEDEWSYINDLAEAWRGRFDDVEAARGDEPVDPEVATAVELLAREAAAIDDPHRAIDWLSTFPQLLLIALGERP